jgi:hypothetical protein
MHLNLLELNIAAPSLATERACFDGSCQKSTVDWLLEAAGPWIRGHPVGLTGCVKTIQREFFEAASLVQRRRVEIWFKKSAGFEGWTLTLADFDEWLDGRREE